MNNKTVIREYLLGQYEYKYLLKLAKVYHLENRVVVKSIDKQYELTSAVSKKIKLVSVKGLTLLAVHYPINNREKKQLEVLKTYLDEYHE